MRWPLALWVQVPPFLPPGCSREASRRLWEAEKGERYLPPRLRCVLDRVAVSAEDNTFCGFLLDRLHTGTTGDEVSNVGFFIAVVVVKMQRPMVVKATARAT